MSATLWKCDECGWRGTSEDFKRAPHPFRQGEEIIGCPQCGCTDEFVNMCDEPGCDREASSGWPSPQGYRRTCHNHAAGLHKEDKP